MADVLRPSGAGLLAKDVADLGQPFLNPENPHSNLPLSLTCCSMPPLGDGDAPTSTP